MKPFAERNQLIVGAVGLTVIAAIILGALNYDKIPLLNRGKSYSAYFVEAGGIRSGASVQVSGLRVGRRRTRRPAGAGEVHRRRQRAHR